MRWVACLFVSLALLLGVRLSLAQPYVIERFSFDGELKPNGLLAVTERIEVLFNEPRRGIIRSIPVYYDTGKGTTRYMVLDDWSVTDANGQPHPIQVEFSGVNMEVRIGDPHVFHTAGTRVTYVIRYTARGVINWFEATSDWQPTAELYWGLTGEEWDAPMKAVDFHVRFPRSPEAKGVRVRVIYGPYGSRLSHTLLKPEEGSFGPETGTLVTLRENEVFGERSEPMPPYHGMTLVLSVPADLIQKPPLATVLLEAVRANLGFTIPLWVLTLMGFFWWKHGRDPSSGPVVVQFEPPDGLGAAELGAFLDEQVDQRDLAAGIVALAVKGHLTITPKEEGLVFKSRAAELRLTGKKDQEGLTRYEAKLLSLLDKCNEPIEESELRRHVAPKVSELHKAIYDDLVKRGYYLRSPNAVREAWGCGGCAVILGLAVVFSILAPFSNWVPSLIGALVAWVILWLFARAMPRRTAKGARAFALARGFEEFIRRARSQELEWMSQKHPDQALFEAYLPHAVALGLTREWAQAFEGIVKEMPSWYGAPPGTAFRPIYFASDLGSTVSSVASAATTPPRSAGAGGGHSGFSSGGFSSGGGFSGGGFGGGGGRSW